MTFYDRLKTLVVESRKSFNQVERELGYPRNALANYRLGKQPSARRLSELADYFDVSDEYLLEKSDDRDHKKVQKLFNKLNPTHRQEILDLIQEKIAAQEQEDNDCTSVPVTSFIYRGDYVWQQGRLDTKADVPNSQIPEKYDLVISPVGSDFFSDVKEGDLLFIKYRSDEKIPEENLGGFIYRNEKFVKIVTEGGRQLYVNEKNPDFEHYLNQVDADNKLFPVATAINIFHTKTRSCERLGNFQANKA